MSVAFRRESDDEHLEPKFELPIPAGPNLVTARGLTLIAGRIADLTAQLAQNDDEERAKLLKRELRYWQTREITAEVAPAATGDVVGLGTRVTFLHNGKKRELSIVGHDEADPANARIAFSAPLGRALMGGEVGDVLAFAGQDDALEVLEIAPID